MKTWKKLFSLFCATVMMCSLLAGCGNSPDTPADDASSEDGGTDWPTKSINMIVPMGAGGDTDFNARTYAKYLEDVLGETVVVTNITGNGGALGSEEVKNASPDGYTCLSTRPPALPTTVPRHLRPWLWWERVPARPWSCGPTPCMMS